MLLRAMLLQAFYSICSERLLMERLDYDCCSARSSESASTTQPGTIRCSRRMLEGDIAAKLLAAVLAQPRVKGLLPSDHFSSDDTVIEAWASM
ncbi:transposase [Bradyrhizobium sp. USDA 4518]